MDATFESTAALADRLAFDAAAVPGVPALVAQIKAALATVDFRAAEFRAQSEALRRELLASPAFASSAERLTPLDLQDGSAVEGRVVGYRESCLQIFTPRGFAEVPWRLIPPDLQRCAPDDPLTAILAGIKVIAAANETLNEASGGLKEIGEGVRLLTDNFEELLSENSRLQMELLALRAER